MTKETSDKIAAILESDKASSEKVKELESLRSDVRALQRAATESPMVGTDGYEEDLQAIDTALLRLQDGDPDEGDENNAATL